VIFVGTGPGDPDLLTLGAIAALADASAVILDDDRQREILNHPGDHPGRGRGGDHHRADRGAAAAHPLRPGQDRAQEAAAGSRVVRLVTGDPFLDNAVADEAAACVRGGIDFEVVPGVSSLTAVPSTPGST
jgi:uroporphyrinogen III methyltransferase/synthase